MGGREQAKRYERINEGVLHERTNAGENRLFHNQKKFVKNSEFVSNETFPFPHTLNKKAAVFAAASSSELQAL